MNKNPVVLLERTNIFPCQKCSRAFFRQNDKEKRVAKFNHEDRDVPELKPSVLGPSSNQHYESKDLVLHFGTRVKDPEIHKGKHNSENKNKMNAVILATTDRNSKQISEIKVKKEKETKDREPIQILVKIPIDSKMAARLQKNNSIRTKAEIMPGIPNALSKQERKDNQKNKTQSNKHSPGILTCGQCPKSFRTIVGMTNHLQNHFKPTYQCSQCPNTFPTLQKLNNHVSRSHKFKRVSCNVCKKEFQSNANLKIHLRTHTGERPFPCKQCGKRFTQNASLYLHNKIHSGIKDNICAYCNKAFTNYHNMKKHELIHTYERPNVCQYCNKGFCDPSALTRHIRTHTGSKIYQCPLCPMKFSDASGLIAHKRRHSGKKDFACKFCDKKFFTRSDNLKHETAVHMDRKDFECELCKKRFALKQYLKIHIVNAKH